MTMPGMYILICAYNERDWIGTTLKQIQQTKLPVHIVVVDDGSSDGTGKIAYENGAEVITLPKNKGKAHAFFVGLRHIQSKKPVAVLSLDADMLQLDKKNMVRLINLAKRATREQRMLMVVSAMRESGDIQKSSPFELKHSGIRSFSRHAISMLFHSRLTHLAEGYGLEAFLNAFFRPLHVRTLRTSRFIQRLSFSKDGRTIEEGRARFQSGEINKTTRSLQENKRLFSRRVWKRMRG